MSSQVYQVTDISGRGAEELLTRSGLTRPVERGTQWLIQSQEEEGLNVYYQLCLVPPQGRKYTVSLPWRAEETCPHCQGQGLVYAWNRDSSAYQVAPCPECLGQGALNHDREIILTVDDGLGGERVIRKRRAGRFNARLGLRGDMVINLTWVEALPGAVDRDTDRSPNH